MSKNKKVALGIASAVIGFTGVAGASVAVSQYSTSDDHGHQAGIAAEAGGVSLETNAAGALADLPVDVDGVIGTVTGLAGGADPTGLLAGAVANAQDIADGALATATGLVPVGLPNVAGITGSCVASAVPAQGIIPIPANTIAAGLAQLAQVESITSMISGLTAGLPIQVPTLLSASDVFAAVKSQVNCAGALAAQSSPLPAACSISAGLPVALPEPAAGLVKDVANMAGQTINVGGGSVVGASCDSSVATSAATSIASNPAGALSTVQGTLNKVAPALNLPKVDVPALPIPSLPAVPGLDAPALPDLGAVTGTLEGVIGSLPVAVPELPVDVNGLLGGILPTSCSASASGGLLGSLTAILSANCG